MQKIKYLAVLVDNVEIRERIIKRSVFNKTPSRIIEKDSAIPDAFSVVTDKEISSKVRSNVWMLLKPEESIESYILKGYRHFFFIHENIKDTELDVFFWNVDSLRTDRRANIRTYEVIENPKVYENEDFSFNFKEEKVVRIRSNKEIFLSRAQVRYLYKYLVCGIKGNNRAMGTKLRSLYGNGLLGAVHEIRREEAVSE